MDLRATSAPTPAVPQAVEPPQLGRAHTTPNGSASDAAVERTFDPLARLESETEPHDKLRVRAASVGSLGSGLALHARIMASRGPTAADRALDTLGLGAAAAPGETPPRRGLLHKMSQAFGVAAREGELSDVAEVDEKSDLLPFDEGDGAARAEGGRAAADGVLQPPTLCAAASCAIDYDAVFSGAAATMAPKQLVLLDLSKVGKLALLTNDRTSWVTTLACISGYDATALSQVSMFWHERLARPTLMAPLWMYYGRDEFPYAPCFVGAKRVGLFGVIAAQLRTNARRRDALSANGASGDGDTAASMQQQFVSAHVERAERRRMDALRASQRARREQQRGGPTCARRCVVHPALCVGTIGCFALPLPLLIATALILSVQSAVVESLPSEAERRLWGVGAYGMWLWIAPIGSIGLCWCIAACAACSAAIAGGMEPHLAPPREDASLSAAASLKYTRTVAQLLSAHADDGEFCLPLHFTRVMLTI